MTWVRKLQRAWKLFRTTLIWDLLVAQKKWVWAMLGLSVVNLAIAGGVLATLRSVVDDGIVDKIIRIDGLVIRFVMLSIAAAITGFVQRQVVARVGYQLEYDLRTMVYDRLLGADPRLLDRLSSGQLVTRAMTDLAVVQRIALMLPSLMLAILPIIAGLFLVLRASLLMGLVALLPLPINMWLIRRIRKRLYVLTYSAFDARARVTTAIDEAVRGIRVVKAFGREEHEQGRVKAQAKRAYTIGLTLTRVLANWDVLLKIVPSVFRSLEMVVGLLLIVNGRMTVGTFLIVFSVGAAFTAFAQGLDEITVVWMGARSGNSRFTEMLVLARPRTARARHESTALPEGGADIAFDGVIDRRLGADTRVDVTAQAGQVVALIGGPGSGRETLTTFIAGHGRPTQGRVLICGADVAELGDEDRRQAVRVVTEQPFLFARSVRANLSVGRSLEDDEIAAALDAAGATDIVADLPDGIDTVLGDRGMTLSGGQRQRLALARALLEPPRVLVLDDALSAVPPAIEQAIVGRIRAHAPETVIVAVTRRDTLRGVADTVFELPDVDEQRAAVQLFERVPSPLAGAMSLGSGQVRNTPDDPRYAAGFRDLQLTDDLPEVDDAATVSEAKPTMPSVLRPFKRRMVLAALFMVLFVAAGLVPEGVTSVVVDAARLREPGRAYPIIGLLFLVGIATGGLAWFQRVYRKKIDEGVLYLLRTRTFHRLTKLGVDFYDRELPGAVATRVVNDLDRVSDFVDETVFRLVSAVTLFLSTYLVILVWSPPVGLTILPFVPVLALLAYAQYRIAKPIAENARKHLGALVSRMEEDFAGRDVIAAYDALPAARGAFNAEARRLRAWRQKAAIVDGAGDQTFGMLAGFASAALLYRAGNLHLDGVISVGSVVALNAYLRSVLAPVRIMASTLERYVPARVAFQKLQELYEVPVFPPDDEAGVPCRRLDGSVALDGVTFTYPGARRPALQGVDLAIEPGELIAVVGATGAGKSSIAKLLARIYDPTEGVVAVDDTDIRRFDVTSFRQRLGVVPQDGFCFAGTVAENVAYGRPDAGREELVAAVTAIGGDRLLTALPNGLDTVVDEEGRNLTVAERQLIALARVWLIEPDVLVLDEATSGLGPALERHVLESVRGLGVTTIFVAHRLAVAEQADRVVVVDEGRVVEVDTHTELLREGGTYAALWGSVPKPERRRARRVAAPAKAGPR